MSEGDGAAAAPLMGIAEFEPFVDGLDHPECVACGPDGEIYAGGEAGQIYRVSLTGEVAQIGTTGGFVLGVCLDGDRNVYACDSAHHAVMRVASDGSASTYSAGAPQRPMVTPNYPVFDAAGNLYVSDSGSWQGNDGCVFRVRPGGATEVLSERLSAFPNGMALDAADRYLYVVLSNLPGVARIDLAAGAEPEPQEVVRLERTVPDGLAFDAAGNLYIACYTPDIIYRLAPDGTLATLVDDWTGTILATPTNVAFCGPELRTLVVASLSRWHLTRTRMAIPGQLLRFPRLGAAANEEASAR